MRRAYRRPVTDADLHGAARALSEKARADGDFDAGIEMALSAVLVSPQFLFRVEPDPAGLAPNTPYRISDLELASRLSFFLWSSIPDDELLDAAIAGKLHEPAVLERQVRRMLADARSRALVTNFAAQWLHLRNLDVDHAGHAAVPGLRRQPPAGVPRRRPSSSSTASCARIAACSICCSANYTFVNERLAKHYGIPHVYGTRFRRITLDEDSWRGGLLRQGSILTVTSYATRTSPVLRGKWVLDNLLGVPPPPPLPDVPALKDNTVDGSLVGPRSGWPSTGPTRSARACHNLMDPVGLSLEKFDAVGRRRTVEDGAPIDASGGLPDGSQFADVDGLEAALLRRPELFVGTLDREAPDLRARDAASSTTTRPRSRAIVRDARAQNFRISSIILGIVKSKPFQMRTSR